MATCPYGNGTKNLCSGNVNWSDAGQTIKVMLVTSSYTVAPDTHAVVSDVSAYRTTGTTDQTLGTRTVDLDTVNHRMRLRCASSVTFESVPAGQTVKGVAVYRDTGVTGTSWLVTWNEFPATAGTNGSNIQVNFDSDGVMRAAYQ